MVITSIIVQKRNPKRFNIYIDGDYKFSANSDDIIELGIREGSVLDQSGLDDLVYRCQFKDAFDRSCRFLGVRARSEYEIKTKLKSDGYDESVISIVVDRLIEMKLIDDREFARMWIEERNLLKPSSKRVLIDELKDKGIDKQIISDTIDEYVPDELDIAIQVTKKKLSQSNSDIKNPTDQQKIYKYLSYKGFDYETSKRAVDMCLNQNDNEIL